MRRKEEMKVRERDRGEGRKEERGREQGRDVIQCM